MTNKYTVSFNPESLKPKQEFIDLTKAISHAYEFSKKLGVPATVSTETTDLETGRTYVTTLNRIHAPTDTVPDPEFPDKQNPSYADDTGTLT